MEAGDTPVAAGRLDRATAVASVLVVLAGLGWYALATDWRLLLWAEFVLAPVGLVAVVTAAAGRGGATIATGVLAVAVHAETWLASLQGTIEGDLLAGGTSDLLTWPARGHNLPSTLVVLGGVAAVAAGARLVSTRGRNAHAGRGVAPGAARPIRGPVGAEPLPGPAPSPEDLTRERRQ